MEMNITLGFTGTDLKNFPLRIHDDDNSNYNVERCTFFHIPKNYNSSMKQH